MLKNEDMQRKTEKVHQEFELWMAKLVERRSKNCGIRAEGFDVEMMDPYYLAEKEPRHASPTKRLIEHMNTAVKHKQVFKEE